MANVVKQIEWKHAFDTELNAATATEHVLLDFSAAPMWAGCARLDAEVYTDPRVIEFVTANFRPVRIHAVEQRDDFQRLGERFHAQWTPTILIIDKTGTERHRIEGFLPSDEFLGQLELGLAKSAFARGKFDEAERRFRAIVERYPKTEAAPEALYWTGVSRYKGTNDASALKETARNFASKYTDSAWATKASVWN